MKQCVTLVLLTAVLLITGCAIPGNVGKTCTQYRNKQVSQSYCAQRAPKTCSTYCDSYGCRSNCFGGGYCQRTAYRTITVRECAAFVCAAGYQRFENGCYTPEQIVVRKERRADNALAIAARERKVPRNSDDAVSAAGFALKIGLYGIDADPERALAFLTRECDSGSGGGCYGLADMYRFPKDGVPERADPAKAEALMRKGCDADYGRACSGLANLIRPRASDGVEFDPDADFTPALALYERACELGDAWGCNQAAALYERRKVAAALPGSRAYALYRRSCGMNKNAGKTSMAEGCVNAARYIYSGVDDLAPDERKGRTLIRRALKLSKRTAEYYPVTECIQEGRGSCGLDVADARIGSAGLITDFDNATASELMAAAKQLNWGTGGVRKDNILAGAYSQRACELRDGAGCYVAGQLAWYSEGELITSRYSAERAEELGANRQEALLWLERSCNLGDGFGCRMLGNVLFADNPVGSVVSMFGQATAPKDDADLEGAFVAYNKGCDAGLPLNCEEAAQMLLEGHTPEPESARRAYELLTRGCEQAVEPHSGDACVFAARLAYNGAQGVPRDRARAAELMEIARRVSTDGDPFDGSRTLYAPRVGHCIVQAVSDEC